MGKKKAKQEAEKTKTKALVLLSGGLDSRLAAKLLQKQGIEVEAVYFDLPFGSGCCKPTCAFNFAQKEGIKLHIFDCKKGRLFQEYLNIIKKPVYGYGTAMNPCIDCRIFMLRKAKKLAEKIGAEIIATGEVLDERPMSQRKKAMEIIEKESGLQGKLLRPLSALHLPETNAEKEGKIDRKQLLAIRGRSRKLQLELAKKFGITFPSPAGGCLLCEKEYARKLADLLKHEKKIKPIDINLLKIGRHFRVGKCKIIVGRNKEENAILEKQKWLKISAGPKSPTTLILGKADKKTKDIAAALTVRYSDYKEARLFGKIVRPASAELIEKLRI